MDAALDPTPCVVRGFDDALARGLQFSELGAQLGLQSLTVNREPSGGPDELRELADVGLGLPEANDCQGLSVALLV